LVVTLYIAPVNNGIGSIKDIVGTPGEGFVWGLVGGLAGGVILDLVWGLTAGAGWGVVYGFIGGLGADLGAVSGAALGVLIGSLLLRPRMEDLSKILPYIQAMAAPLAGFMVAYLGTMIWFAGCYATIYRWNPENFFITDPSRLSIPQFGEFVFFSLMNLVPLGYSSLQPQSLLARSLVSIEAILGTLWMVAGFAGVIAYVQPRFDKIANGGRDKRDTLLEEVRAVYALVLDREDESRHGGRSDRASGQEHM
jgi:hypothetical protein